VKPSKHKPTELVKLDSISMDGIDWFVQDFPGQVTRPCLCLCLCLPVFNICVIAFEQQEFHASNLSFMGIEQSLFVVVYDLTVGGSNDTQNKCFIFFNDKNCL